MTIKKIAFSLAAASVVGTYAFAGSLTATTTAQTIAEELLVGQDVNGTSVDINSTYQTSLNAGVNDGKMLLEFNHCRIPTQNLSNLHLVNLTQNTEVGTNPVLSGSAGQKLIFDINGSINDSDRVHIETTGNTDNNATLTIDFLKNNTSFFMKYSLLGNNDDLRDSSNEVEIAKTKQEWEVSVSKYDALIDASSAFKKFTDATSTSNGTVDVASINVKQNSVGVSSGALTLNEVITADNNVSKFATSWAKLSGSSIVLDSNLKFDENVTYATTTEDNATFTADATHEIKKSQFKIALNATKTANNTKFTKEYVAESPKNFGEWKIYGYNAQIPNVRGDGDFETDLKFTNRSGLETKVYFTLIDQDGTVVQLDSSEVSSVKAQLLSENETVGYKASELITLAHAKDSAFATVGTVSVEVSIPTTPSSVYGFASFKNANLKQFKDLPVYNTSEMTY